MLNELEIVMWLDVFHGFLIINSEETMLGFHLVALKIGSWIGVCFISFSRG